LVKFYAGVTEDLTLYAQQLGWFHSTPKSEKPTKDKQPTRAEKITANGGKPLMPEVDAEYLISYWHDMGLVSSGAMGAASLSAIEIDAYCRLCAVELEPWEFKAIKQMSQNYANYLQLGENPDQPPPYGNLTQDFDRELVGKKVSNAFKAFLTAGRK
jgi:hypothetical protein